MSAGNYGCASVPGLIRCGVVWLRAGCLSPNKGKPLTNSARPCIVARMIDITNILDNENHAIAWQGSHQATVRVSLDDTQAAEIAPATMRGIVLDAAHDSGCGFTLVEGIGGWRGSVEPSISIMFLGKSAAEIQPGVCAVIDACFERTSLEAAQVEYTNGREFQTAEVRRSS